MMIQSKKKIIVVIIHKGEKQDAGNKFDVF